MPIEYADRVVRARFWTDERIRGLSMAGRLLYVWLWAVADQDGIAPFNATEAALAIGSNIEQAEVALHDVEMADLAVSYVQASTPATPWVWVPMLRANQPTAGQLKPDRDPTRPAPSARAVLDLLSRRLGRLPTDAEMRNASPRTFGLTRGPAPPSSGDVARVFEVWRTYQKAPSLCRLGADKPAIEAALRVAPADALVWLMVYAYESDEPGPRYWRGENQTGATYLGLKNLLQLGKLSQRLQWAQAFRERRERQRTAKDVGVQLGGAVSAHEAEELMAAWTKPHLVTAGSTVGGA